MSDGGQDAAQPTGRRKLSAGRHGSLVALSTGLAALLLLWLVRRMESPEALLQALGAAARRPAWLAAALLCVGLGLAAGALRWWVLLRATRLGVPLRRVVQLYAVGHFFNMLVPGSTGGDLVKAGCVAVDCPGRRPEAVTTVIAERLIGLLSLCLLLALVTTLRPGFYHGRPELAPLRLASLGLGLAAAVCIAIIGWLDLEPLLGIMMRWRHGRALIVVATRAYRVLRGHVQRPRVLWTSAALSLVGQGCSVGSLLALARSLRVDLAVGDAWSVVPVVNTIAGLPVTPGGAGVREAATFGLLQYAGVSEVDALTLALLMFGCILIWALLGGGIYWCLRMTRRGPS